MSFQPKLYYSEDSFLANVVNGGGWVGPKWQQASPIVQKLA